MVKGLKEQGADEGVCRPQKQTRFLKGNNMGVPIMTIVVASIFWGLSTNAYSGDSRLVKGSDYTEYVEYLQTVLDRDTGDSLKIHSLNNCSFVINNYWQKTGFLKLFWGRLQRENAVKRIVFSLEIGRYAPIIQPLPNGLELVIENPPVERYWCIAVVETADTYLLARWSSEPNEFLSTAEQLIDNDSLREIGYVEVSGKEVDAFVDSINAYYSHLYSTNIYDYPMERSKHSLRGCSHCIPMFAFFTINDAEIYHTSFIDDVWSNSIQGNDISELYCFLDILVSPNGWAPWLCKGETWDDFEDK